MRLIGLCFVGWLLYVLLMPSAVVVWHNRRLLRRWLWMTARHPVLMAQSAREVRRELRQGRTP